MYGKIQEIVKKSLQILKYIGAVKRLRRGKSLYWKMDTLCYVHIIFLCSDLVMDFGGQLLLVPNQNSLSQEIIVLTDTYASKNSGQIVIIVIVGRKTFLGLDLSHAQRDTLLFQVAGS